MHQQKSRAVKYEACPKCRSNGRDSRGDNLVRYHDGGGHCFSCGYHEHAKSFNVFTSQQRQPVTKENHVTKGVLPYDFTREVPSHAWKWLLQYGLPWSHWKESTGYSPSEERLVFRVGEQSTNVLQFSIGRYTPEKQSDGGSFQRRGGTVVDRTPRKWYVWGDSHRHCEVVGRGESVVLVEDLISAHKVGQVTTAIPLFGTEIHKPHLYYLMNEGKPVWLWLDKDQEGTVKKKAMKLQAMINQPVNIVVTDHDPKELSFEDIKTASGLH